MPKSYKKLQQRLTFDNLMTHLDQQFRAIADHRRANTSYSLDDVLKSAFAMFSLKSPSLLSFQEQTRIERRNLKQIYRIQKIPADSQMRTVLDFVEPLTVRRMGSCHCSLCCERQVWSKNTSIGKSTFSVRLTGWSISTQPGLPELHDQRETRWKHQRSACGIGGSHCPSRAKTGFAN